MQKPHTLRLLQYGDFPTHRGPGQAERASRTGERACTHDLNENSDLVEVHDLFVL